MSAKTEDAQRSFLDESVFDISDPNAAAFHKLVVEAYASLGRATCILEKSGVRISEVESDSYFPNFWLNALKATATKGCLRNLAQNVWNDEKAKIFRPRMEELAPELQVLGEKSRDQSRRQMQVLAALILVFVMSTITAALVKHEPSVEVRTKTVSISYVEMLAACNLFDAWTLSSGSIPAEHSWLTQRIPFSQGGKHPIKLVCGNRVYEGGVDIEAPGSVKLTEYRGKATPP